MTSNYLFFYGHNQDKNGVKACFSNFYPSDFTENDILFNCNEQYMMYHKALLFQDHLIAKQILESNVPKDIKALGRKVKDFNIDIWEENARKIVTQGSFLKFTQNPKLLEILLDTKDDILVEASPYDKIWGIGLKEKDAINVDPSEWPGKNWLGECLMNVRTNVS